jgi:hypothetical protein
MVPFDVHMGKQRASITFDSLVWFFVVTAAATVVGTLVYDKWVSPYLNDLPSLPIGNQSPPVSVQTPSAMGRMGHGRR